MRADPLTTRDESDDTPLITTQLQRFDTGEIRLPLMQRDYVWKPKKVVRLLDSLCRRWPIGSFYVWQRQDAHPTKARVGPVVTRRLDGFFTGSF